MRVEEHVDVDARRKDVWEKLADTVGVAAADRQRQPDAARRRRARRTPSWASRYRMRMHVGSADVGGLVEVVELDEGRDMAWTSVTGIDQRGRWRLRDLEEGGTRITLRLSYGAPGGIVGALTEQIAVGQVRTNVRRGLARLKADIDGVSAEVEGETAVSEQTKGLLGKAAYQLGGVKILAERGRGAPDAARQARPPGQRPAPLGPQPRRGLHHRGHPQPRRARRDRRAGHADLQGDRPAHQRAGRRPGRRRRQGGRRRGDHVPQPPRLRRGHRGQRQAGRPQPVPEHRVRRPADHRGGQAREAGGDRVRPGVHRPAGGRRQPAQAVRGLGRRPRRARGPDARGADRGRPDRAAGAAGEHRQDDHPDLGHHRHAQGRQPRLARHAGPGHVVPVQDPAAVPGHVAHRGAAVPLVGLRALQPRPAAGHHAGAHAQVRARGVAAADRPEQGRRAGGGAGDDAAHPRPARGDARASTTCRR